VRVVIVGASEMGRIRKEWEKGESRMKMDEEIFMKGGGGLDRREGVRIEEELKKGVISSDNVVSGDSWPQKLSHGE
jgi:hypothetical protein